jgi:glucosyl-3-phosphoglycerate phosphatase
MWFEESGIVDADLSEKGEAQARELEKRLRGVEIDLVVCSPLTRAVKTMQLAVGERKVKTIVTPIVRERCDRMADTGKEWKELKKIYTQYELKHFDRERWWECREKKETNDEVKERIKGFKEFLKSRDEKAVLVVTHGNYIRFLMNQMIMIQNCGLIKTDLDSLLKINY